jgi:hypothetical protein
MRLGSSAHFLWTTMCAMPFDTAQVIDLKQENIKAQI